jgi:hypothetical protein
MQVGGRLKANLIIVETAELRYAALPARAARHDAKWRHIGSRRGRRRPRCQSDHGQTGEHRRPRSLNPHFGGLHFDRPFRAVQPIGASAGVAPGPAPARSRPRRDSRCSARSFRGCRPTPEDKFGSRKSGSPAANRRDHCFHLASGRMAACRRQTRATVLPPGPVEKLPKRPPKKQCSDRI